MNEAQVQELLDNLEAEGVLFVNTITRKNGCTYWALDECPFKGGEHEGMEVGAGKTCIVLSQTALGFSCFAGSCSEYTFGDFTKWLLEEHAIKLEWDIYKTQTLPELEARWGGVDDLGVPVHPPTPFDLIRLLMEKRKQR